MTENKEEQKLKEDAETEEQNQAAEAEIQQEEADTVKKDLSEAIKNAQEMKDLAQRVQAEFDNYRKRNNEAVKIARQEGEDTVLYSLCQVTDNFERAIAQVDEQSKEGVNLIFKQISSILEKFGTEEIAAMDEDFNPNEHNAVMTVEDKDKEGKVVEVLQKGYKRNHKILRTAMVKVAK